MKIRVLYNPGSGFQLRSREDIDRLQAIFLGYGLKAEMIRLTEKYQCTVLARRAVKDGCGMVVVVGGDGTVNEAVCGMVHSDVPLGIIPAGSGNGICRTLGIPLDPLEACRVIAEGFSRRIDVGILNGHHFLGVAGIGYDALVGYLFEQRWGKLRGLWNYFLSAVVGYFQYRPYPLELRTDHETRSLAPLLVTAANTTQFGGGAIIAPDAKPDDGLFDVCIVHQLNFFQALYYWPRLFSGRINTVPQWEMLRTDTLEVTSDKPLPVHVDGDFLELSAHVRISLVPGGLSVRVPR